MLEARIVSRTGSLYFAGKPTAHDLGALRAHVRALAGGATDVRVELSVSESDWTGLVATGRLAQLETAGASVCRCPAKPCSADRVDGGAPAPPMPGARRLRGRAGAATPRRSRSVPRPRAKLEPSHAESASSASRCGAAVYRARAASR